MHWRRSPLISRTGFHYGSDWLHCGLTSFFTTGFAGLEFGFNWCHCSFTGFHHSSLCGFITGLAFVFTAGFSGCYCSFTTCNADSHASIGFILFSVGVTAGLPTRCTAVSHASIGLLSSLVHRVHCWFQ